MTIFKGHGSAVAVVLSVLAVVVAGGGTAVAVSSAVTIADPSVPSRVAHVDPSGRLQVGDAQSTIDATGYLYGYHSADTTQITSATTATLAISRIELSSPSGNAAATEEQLSLNKYPTDATGTCVTTTTPTLLARYNVAGGDDIDDQLPAPIVVKPTGTAKYCLYINTLYLGDTNGIPAYYVVYGVTAYTTFGNYTGIGAGGSAAAKQPSSPRIGG